MKLTVKKTVAETIQLNLPLFIKLANIADAKSFELLGIYSDECAYKLAFFDNGPVIIQAKTNPNHLNIQEIINKGEVIAEEEFTEHYQKALSGISELPKTV